MPSYVIALATVGAMTLILGSLLVIANRTLYVYDDPRIDIVDDMLPHANCGACGYPGCRPFAEALVAGAVAPGRCTVSSADAQSRIAAFLGVDVGAEAKRVARLACAGGRNVARDRAEYQGLSSCAAEALVAGGGKSCLWGCLSLGDCAVACAFAAIHMDDQGLPVVDEDRCTACGDCVDACPKNLFSLHPLGHSLWVACRSLAAGDEILDDCRVACTACGRCAMDAPGLITMSNNLPIIDYRRLAAGSRDAGKQAIERCPTGAIGWFDGGRLIKGPNARVVIRREPRREAAT